MAGFFLAMTTAGVFVVALVVMGWWISFGWWRVLATGGAILSLFLMLGFFGATRLLPIALDLFVLRVAVTDRLPVPAT